MSTGDEGHIPEDASAAGVTFRSTRTIYLTNANASQQMTDRTRGRPGSGVCGVFKDQRAGLYRPALNLAALGARSSGRRGRAGGCHVPACAFPRDHLSLLCQQACETPTPTRTAAVCMWNCLSALFDRIAPDVLPRCQGGKTKKKKKLTISQSKAGVLTMRQGECCRRKPHRPNAESGPTGVCFELQLWEPRALVM